MLLPQGWRDNGIRQLLAHDLTPRIAKGSFSGRIEFYDAPFVVNRDYAIEGRVQHRGLARLTLFPRFVALRAFNSYTRDVCELGNEVLLR
jgi:hypothetical protein